MRHIGWLSSRCADRDRAAAASRLVRCGYRRYFHLIISGRIEKQESGRLATESIYT
jgi:hypothetical protein